LAATTWLSSWERADSQVGNKSATLASATAAPVRLPLSLEQQGYLGLGRSGYGTIASCSEVTGRLRIGALTDAVREVIGRHEPLRMRLQRDAGEVSQVFLEPGAVRADWTQADIDDDSNLDDYLMADLVPDRDGAVRLLILNDSEDHAYALALIDHLACDGWSSRLFLGELWHAYRAITAGRGPGLPPISGSYSGFIDRQRAMAKRSERNRGYWEAHAERFACAATGLPQASGPARDGLGRADIVAVANRHGVERARELARALGVSPNTLPLAALVLAAASLADSDTVGISFAYAGRDRQDLHPLIGVFHRRVPLLADQVTAGSLGDFVTGLSRSVLDALRHSRAPYSASEFDAAVQGHRDRPLVDVLYNQVSEFFGQPSGRGSVGVGDDTEVSFPGTHFRPARWHSYQESRLRLVVAGGTRPAMRLIFNEGLVAETQARLLLDRTLAIVESMSPAVAGSPTSRFVSSAIAGGSE
jgi:hypothetical protein